MLLTKTRHIVYTPVQPSFLGFSRMFLGAARTCQRDGVHDFRLNALVRISIQTGYKKENLSTFDFISTLKDFFCLLIHARITSMRRFNEYQQHMLVKRIMLYVNVMFHFICRLTISFTPPASTHTYTISQCLVDVRLTSISFLQQSKIRVSFYSPKKVLDKNALLCLFYRIIALYSLNRNAQNAFYVCRSKPILFSVLSRDDTLMFSEIPPPHPLPHKCYK